MSSVPRVGALSAPTVAAARRKNREVVISSAPASTPSDTPSRPTQHRLVIAGAGSGKTQHMASLIAETLAATPTANIFAISYTNRARDVLRERVESLKRAESEFERVRFGTIHQFALSLMAVTVGSLPVADEKTCQAWLARQFPARMIDAKLFRAMAACVCASNGLHVRWPEPWHADAWIALRQHLAQSKKTDFTGMLLGGIEAATSLPCPFTHVFVDEFQDTNGLQFEMLRRLAARGISICVVGDAEQSIFGFAGAIPNALHTFETEFKAVRTSLGRNYRSGREIVRVANQLRRDGVCQSAARDAGGLVRMLTFGNRSEAAAAVATHIAAQINEDGEAGRSIGDFAILARTRGELKDFESALKARQIPVIQTGAAPFHEQRRVPLILCLVRCLDSLEKTSIAIGALAALGQREAAAELQQFATAEPELPTSRLLSEFSSNGRIQIDKLVNGIESVRGMSSALAAQIEQLHAHFVVPSLGIFERAGQGRAAGDADIATIVQLAAYTAIAPSDFARMIEQEGAITFAETGGVRLATVHDAKGDEWSCVFVANAGKSSFPHPMSSDAAEECRLLYVACTRAADELVLCVCDGNEPSPFIAQLTSEGL